MLTPTWRPGGIGQTSIHDMLVDEMIRLLDPGKVTELTVPRPQTDEELLDLTEYYIGVRIPRVAVCDGHVAPARAFCDAYFARHPWAVWKAARGLGGKSFMLAALGWMEALTLRSSVAIQGGSAVQSRRVHDYMRQFWMKPHAPTAAMSGEPSARVTRLVWGNEVQTLAASQKDARGLHFPRVRIDEADEVEWAILEAVRGQPMSTKDVRSNMVFSSTHQYADGPMTRLMREAREKGFPVYSWCYKETSEPYGWMSDQMRADFKSTVSAELWRVEVELGEPSPEGRAIDSAAVEQMFMGPSVPVVEGEYKEFEPPRDGAVYGTGADWAKENDYTEIVTFRVDVQPMRLVAYEWMGRRPWPAMIERLHARMRRFPGEAFHDVTGIGGVIRDYIEEPVYDFSMNGRPRVELFSDYIMAIERGELVSPRVERLYGQHKYVRNIDLFSQAGLVENDTKLGSKNRKGHPPDGFVAAALAYKAAFSSRSPIGLISTARDQEQARQQSPSGGLGSALDYLSKR